MDDGLVNERRRSTEPNISSKQHPSYPPQDGRVQSVPASPPLPSHSTSITPIKSNPMRNECIGCQIGLTLLDLLLRTWEMQGKMEWTDVHPTLSLPSEPGLRRRPGSFLISYVLTWSLDYPLWIAYIGMDGRWTYVRRTRYIPPWVFSFTFVDGLDCVMVGRRLLLG